MKKFIIAAFVLVAIILVFRSRPTVTHLAQDLRKASPTQEAETIIGKPKVLKITALNIDTVIEEVGMEESGRMGVPKSAFTAGWWSLGVRPGQKGSAVLAGHLDTPEGAPGIFFELDTLSSGDTIEIVDENNKTFTFEVTRIETYLDSTFPIQTVFADDTGTYLNLITCWGTWDTSAKNYEERLVVFSKLKV